MLRQCAWCLHLIDFAGERVSVQPLPKLYEASHGMCDVCGILWMEQVFSSLAPQVSSLYLSGQGATCIPQASSSLNYAAGLSSQQQEGGVASMMVCEGTSSYSSHAVYPLSEEQEPTLEDNTSILDLDGINRQRKP